MNTEGTGERLLNKLAYLELLTGKGEPCSYDSDIERVLSYAENVWPSLDLKARKLRKSDVVGCYKHGAVLMFHIKAFPRKRPETNLVLISDFGASEFLGHILIDLAAEYSTPHLECPSSDYEGKLQPEELESLLAEIEPDDDDPFAILATGDGTYIQTLCTDEGYLLEYQLVNTSSHYETSGPVTFEEVVAAFTSYGFEGTEWLRAFDWQKQELD
tara:strand:+ start:9732 stop:10376 length:645 start_codon:yes stop_codon:yes gene_type:complete